MPIEPFDFTYTLTSQSEEYEVLNTLGKGRIKEFEPKSYFFTESTIAAQSTAEGAYGPDYVSTNTKFNITTQFQLADKKAYAVTNGQVLIVPQTGTGNESKVNVFIKPLKHVDVGVPIKYYVYRGLKKELFVDSNNNIAPKNETNTPFIAKVWTDLINHNKLTEPLPEIPASLFGYTATETNTNSLDAKFFNTYDSTAIDEHKVYNLAIIEAGQYFGDFKDDKGGFEIVLNDGFYYQEKSDTGFQFDLAYAKSERMVLDIADIAGKPNISEKIYRENVQKFLDPAAFYGAHITEKEKGEIKFVDTTTTYTNKADIYNNVVSKFYNKHKCYIYIQDNKGRSFNFDGALGTEPLKIGVSKVVTPGLYKTNGWPIVISELVQTHTADENEKKKSINNLSFQLKFKTVNKNVVLYNTYGNCTNKTIEGKFLSNVALVNKTNIATQNYTNSVNYNLINNYNLIDNSLVTKNIATFIYINYKEKEVDYFNDFFGPININPIIKLHDEVPNSVIQKASNKNLKINSQDGILSVYNQELIVNGKAGALTEDNKTRLYVLKRLDSINNSELNSNESFSSSDGFDYANTKEDYNAYIYGDKKYIVWKGTIGHGTGKTRTLQLTNFEQDTNTTNFIQLGLTEVNFNKLIYNNEEKVENSTYLPADATNIFFHLDDNGIVQNPEYKKYKLGIKYLTNNIITFTFPTDDIYVYTIDGYYFFTKEYSEKFEFAEEFGNSTINFRPKDDYQGEFGFDWLRVTGDSELSYESIIESGYKKTEGIADTKFTKEEAFQALKKEYINIKTQIEQEIYYVPFLNIYPKNLISEPSALSTVKLKGIPLIDESSINIRFDCDTSLLSVSSNLTVIDQFTSNIEITVTCLKEFDKDQIIKTIGTSTDLAGNIQENVIGLIKVCKNSKTNISTAKVVLVKVLTDITKSGIPDSDSDYYPNFIGENEIKRLKDTLFQSFVYVENLETSKFTLNMSEVPEFQKNGTYYKKQKEKINDVEVDMEYIHNLDKNGMVPGMQDVLIAKLNKEAPQFRDYIKVFVFAVNGLNPENKPLMGRSNGIGSKACAIYKRRKIPVLTHEFLHTIGLCHTHTDQNGLIENPHQKYVYPKYNADPDSGPLHTTDTTDNIMSYNFNKMKSTWKWQWKILKSILNKTI